MTHSPEPWIMSKPYKGETGGKCVSITGVHALYYEGVCYNTDQEKADAERIVACVNACKGIPTEELDWVSVQDRKPERDGKFFIFAPSADPDMPLVAMAWYHADYGWSMLPPQWIEAITHWRSIPQNRPTL